MDFKSRTVRELNQYKDRLMHKKAFLGFDGFVDTIVTPVAQRTGHGENFTPIGDIAEFGQRILGAAGKSTNLEFHPRLEKLGGNGPIMGNALLGQGVHVTYVGALGRTQVHPVFADFFARANVISICAPAQTTAVEFRDGKLMLGMMRSFDEITPEHIDTLIGGIRGYRDFFGTADLVALVNWTMIPHMTAIFDDLLRRVLPQMPAYPRRTFFFDLADPEKRSARDLIQVLETIARFEQFGHVTLGLNFKEMQQVVGALGLVAAPDSEAGLRESAGLIRGLFNLTTVVVHPKESAACATRDGTWWVPGPYLARPLITTGAGDHFNAGFSAGQLMGCSPEVSLGLGVATSGHYVRTAKSPNLGDLEDLLNNWN